MYMDIPCWPLSPNNTAGSAILPQHRHRTRKLRNPGTSDKAGGLAGSTPVLCHSIYRCEQPQVLNLRMALWLRPTDTRRCLRSLLPLPSHCCNAVPTKRHKVLGLPPYALWAITPGARKNPAHPLHRQPLHQGELRLSQDSGWRRPHRERRLRWESELPRTKGCDCGPVQDRSDPRTPSYSVGRHG